MLPPDSRKHKTVFMCREYNQCDIKHDIAASLVVGSSQVTTMPGLPLSRVKPVTAPDSPRCFIVEEVDDLESLQRENEDLRRQLSQLQNRINLEQDELITKLRRQNQNYLRRISRLQGVVVQVASALRASFAACQDSIREQANQNHDVQQSEEIHVYSKFESDDD